MAVSQIEEKILGRLAAQAEPVNPLLSAALYQVLGLSILLSRKLFRARKVRRLDITRDTKSLQLYHHIIWLAREGLSLTEVYVLPCCGNGKYGAEHRVMAAKLRASFYHVFCLFHNHPPISAKASGSPGSNSSHSSGRGSKGQRQSPPRPPRDTRDDSSGRKNKSRLRDPIPSMTSEVSYVTNPFAFSTQTPPPTRPVPPVPSDPARRTPIRPPGLNIPSPTYSGSFLLPSIDFVPMAKAHFEAAQYLANNLLPPAHALRLSVSLEHAAFAWDCEKNYERSRQLARRTIKDVYASTEGLDDDEFADAAALVQTLAGLLRRGGANEASPPQRTQSGRSASANAELDGQRQEPFRIDRTIAVSPIDSRMRQPLSTSPINRESLMPTPERLSTVPEVESTASDIAPIERSASTSVPPASTAFTSPPISRRSSRRPSSAASDKASKRRLVEQAEEAYRRRNSNASRTSARSPADSSVSVRSDSRKSSKEGISHGRPSRETSKDYRKDPRSATASSRVQREPTTSSTRVTTSIPTSTQRQTASRMTQGQQLSKQQDQSSRRNESVEGYVVNARLSPSSNHAIGRSTRESEQVDFPRNRNNSSTISSTTNRSGHKGNQGTSMLPTAVSSKTGRSNGMERASRNVNSSNSSSIQKKKNHTASNAAAVTPTASAAYRSRRSDSVNYPSASSPPSSPSSSAQRKKPPKMPK